MMYPLVEELAAEGLEFRASDPALEKGDEIYLEGSGRTTGSVRPEVPEAVLREVKEHLEAAVSQDDREPLRHRAWVGCQHGIGNRSSHAVQGRCTCERCS